MRDESNGEDVLTVRSDGSVLVSEVYRQSEELSDLFYSERIGRTTVLCVPLDYDYLVTWEAEKDGTVECLQAISSVRAGSRYPGAASEKIPIRAGDTGIAFRSREYEPVPLEGFTEKSFDARTLTEFLGIASLGFNWRLALTLLLSVLALIVCIPLCLFAASRPSRRKRYSFLTWALLCLLGISALEAEGAYWFFADQAWTCLVWKGAAALSCLLLFILLRREKGPLPQALFLTVLLTLAANFVLSLHPAAGLALLLLSHVLLCCGLLRRAPMRRGKWIQWAVVSLALDTVILLFLVPRYGAMGWNAAACAPVLLLMAFCSFDQPLRIRVSLLLFLISDLLLGLYGTLLHDPLFHAACTFLFYTALLMLLLGPSRSAAPASFSSDCRGVTDSSSGS